MRSPPAILPKVCIGPSTSPQHQGRVNISWDPLPCHLQNGADITSYIIQYTHLSTLRITSSRSDVQCSEECGGLYSCVVAESLIPSNQVYSIQVAAQNTYGQGSFSDPINVSSRCYFLEYLLNLWLIHSLLGPDCINSADASTTSGPIMYTSSDDNGITSIIII